MQKLPDNGLYLTGKDNAEYSSLFQDRFHSCYGCAPSTLPIRTITFIVTEECNLACTYCYENHKTKRYMSEEVAFEAIDMLFDEERIGHYFDLEGTEGYIIEFFGGEPFLNTELIEKIIERYLEVAYRKNKTIFSYSHFSTSTNGTLYQQEKVQKLIKKYHTRFSVGITIDGNKELHDSCRIFKNGEPSYDIVEKAVKDYIAFSDSSYNTKLTIAPENVSFLCDAFINLWTNVGIQMINANCVFEDVWAPHHATILYDQLIKVADYLLEEERYKRYYVSLFDETIGQKPDSIYYDQNFCGGNGSMLAITPDGKLYPCARFAPYCTGSKRALSIGNVFDGVDRSNKELESLKSVTLRSQSPQKCLDCDIATGCGLCTAYNYEKFGTANQRATFICDCHKAIVKANEYYWNKLYQKLKIDKSL